MPELTLFSENSFYEFALILALGALLGAVGQLFRQPLIVTFIALGIIVGPSVLDIIRSKENIHLLAKIGIAILLFIVGLKLDMRIIRSVGKIALLTGLGQVAFTSLTGYFIGVALGFSPVESFYIAVALTFSSTIIIVKLLSDKKEIDSLHGQISIGLLIVQDIVVIFVMIILSAMKQGGDFSLFQSVAKTLGSGMLLLIFALLSMRWIIPGLSSFLAKSQELLTLFAIAWSVILATAGELIGCSGEVGAFLAGISLASSDFKETISSRLVSLRDFLLLFFFVNLGADLNLSALGHQIIPAIIFSIFVLIGKPLIVLMIMGYKGYRKRTSFLAGLTMAQVSEFSLIFAGLGLAVGHISDDIVGLVTLVGLITIGLSTYLILYTHQIYEVISPSLKLFERKIQFREDIQAAEKNNRFDVVIIGIGRFGGKLAEIFDQDAGISYLGIDFDPAVIKRWQNNGKNILYGDVEDPDLLQHIPYKGSKIIISTVPYYRHSKQLIKALTQARYKGQVFVTALNDNDYEMLQSDGAKNVLRLHQMAATNFYNTYLSDRIGSCRKRGTRQRGLGVE